MRATQVTSTTSGNPRLAKEGTWWLTTGGAPRYGAGVRHHPPPTYPTGRAGYACLVSLLSPLSPDDERVVDLSDDDPILPESTLDDTDTGWGESERGNDDRLLDERPPHWD
jgi:hypothetical protein